MKYALSSNPFFGLELHECLEQCQAHRVHLLYYLQKQDRAISDEVFHPFDVPHELLTELSLHDLDALHSSDKMLSLMKDWFLLLALSSYLPLFHHLQTRSFYRVIPSYVNPLIPSLPQKPIILVCEYVAKTPALQKEDYLNYVPFHRVLNTHT